MDWRDLPPDEVIRHARGSALHRPGDDEPFVRWPDFNHRAVDPNIAIHACLDNLVWDRAQIEEEVHDGVARVRKFRRVLSCPNEGFIDALVLQWKNENVSQWTNVKFLKYLEEFTYLLEPGAKRDNKSELMKIFCEKVVNDRRHDLGAAYQSFHLAMFLLDGLIENEA